MTTMQRTETQIAKTAIDQFVATGNAVAEIEGYTILISRSEDNAENFELGFYLPGSVTDGDCDRYFTCDRDGEQIDQEEI